MVKWAFERLSDLQLGGKKVTLNRQSRPYGPTGGAFRMDRRQVQQKVMKKKTQTQLRQRFGGGWIDEAKKRGARHIFFVVCLFCCLFVCLFVCLFCCLFVFWLFVCLFVFVLFCCFVLFCFGLFFCVLFVWLFVWLFFFGLFVWIDLFFFPYFCLTYNWYHHFSEFSHIFDAESEMTHILSAQKNTWTKVPPITPNVVYDQVPNSRGWSKRQVTDESLGNSEFFGTFLGWVKMRKPKFPTAGWKFLDEVVWSWLKNQLAIVSLYNLGWWILMLCLLRFIQAWYPPGVMGDLHPMVLVAAGSVSVEHLISVEQLWSPLSLDLFLMLIIQEIDEDANSLCWVNIQKKQNPWDDLPIKHTTKWPTHFARMDSRCWMLLSRRRDQTVPKSPVGPSNGRVIHSPCIPGLFFFGPKN